MALPIQLIVGLGNPGDKYASTRHNAGAWFVQHLAERAACTLRSQVKFQGKLAETQFSFLDQSYPCSLLLPTTYMNKSGHSVQATCQYYKIPPETILVVHDEIDLPPGTVRLKFDGGAGGHNGLKDIMEHLKTQQFYRLRVGVGHPEPGVSVADYVLSPPSKAERHAIETALERSQDILPLLLEGHFQKAMQQLHSE